MDVGSGCVRGNFEWVLGLKFACKLWVYLGTHRDLQHPLRRPSTHLAVPICCSYAV